MSSSSIDTTHMSLEEYIESLEISFQHLQEATKNFADENLLTTGSFSKVYKGRLWLYENNIVACKYPDRKILDNELMACQFLKHTNILTISRFATAGDDVYIIEEQQANASLDKHLSGPTLTWMQRLYICVEVAHALKYLHFDAHHNQCIIHGNIKSSNILLDHDWKAKLHDFRCVVKAAKHTVHFTDEHNGSLHYRDPEYENTLTHKSDVFSFGVVLFEVLFGKEASTESNDNLYFVQLARSHCEEEKLDDLIDPDLRKQMNLKSLNIFVEIAYCCIKEQRSQRPNMSQVLSKLEEACNLQYKHENPTAAEVELASNRLKVKSLDQLKFRLSDINFATNNFSENCIGSGGYGKVYKAQLGIGEMDLSKIEGENKGNMPKKHSTVAIKRIFSRHDKQGEQGFLAEIVMLSNVKHQNVVSLLGFCDEEGEMILVYDYIANGSLADYLENISHKVNLTWAQRIQICIDVAHGLKYLHTSTKDKQRIIHRDIKSDNILLDENWVAKIADFGLSRLLHTIQQGSTLVTNNIAGTKLYWDPEYLSTGRLKTKSDIYSFGVVLFEIMSGKLADDKSYGQKGLPSIARRCFKERTFNKLIDHRIMEVNENILMPNGVVDEDSLKTFTNVAYQCLAKTQIERPTIEVVIKELEKALNFQVNSKNNPCISLEAIKLGTQNFSYGNCIGEGRFWKLYKGEVEHANGCTNVVVKRWDTKSNRENIQFSREIYILSRYKHEKIIGLVGYCNEGNENIIVYENASNGLLSKHLCDPSLAWTKRLKICIDIANGLNFLHEGGAEHSDPIKHGDIKSGSILLDGDWNAKISNFEVSCKADMQKKAEQVDDSDCNSSENLDSENKNWDYLTNESDIYSLGVILIEMLCGRLVRVEGCEDQSQSLGHLAVVRHYAENGNLDEMIFEGIKEQIGPKLSNKFEAIAIECLQHDQAQRPRAYYVAGRLKEILEFQKLHMSLGALNLATQTFSEDNCIEKERFCKFYKGEIKHANGCTSIIAKRWDKNSGQGHILFTKELDYLFECMRDKPEDIIGLVGYCNEENEKIIVYEHASDRRRLDKHLGDPSLTWRERLNIGIDIANALNDIRFSDVDYNGYIRSRDIILDGNWSAKISNINGQVDPDNPYPRDNLGNMSMYSIGVILLEMLCGRLAWTEGCKDYSQSLDNLANVAKENIDDLIFEGIKEQIAPESLIRYQHITFLCLEKNPSFYLNPNQAVIELENALELQEDYEAWESKLPINYKEIIREMYSGTKKKNLYDMLSKGIQFQDGKVFFSIGSDGEGNEMISARKFSYKSPSLHKSQIVKGSRFSKVSKMLDSSNLNVHIKIRSLFLCPSVNYKVYLIFKFCDSRKSKAKPMYVNLKYKMGNESLCAYFATWREDGWMMVELFQFLCHKKDTDFEVLLESFSRSYCGRHPIYIEGIQFQEIRNVKHEEIDKLKEVQQVVVKSKSKANEGKEDKMLHAREVVDNSSNLAIQSRFEWAIEFLREQVFHIKCKIKNETLSSDKENVCYLVFKLPDELCGLHGPVVVRDEFHWRNKETRVFYFRSPKTWNLHDTDSVPREREDGWMEVIVWKYKSNYELQNDHLFVNLKFVTYEGTMAGLIVRNIEFR